MRRIPKEKHSQERRSVLASVSSSLFASNRESPRQNIIQEKPTLKIQTISTCAMLLGIGLAAQTHAAETSAKAQGTDGKTLFRYHGCINCHGAEANQPISKVIPKLAGKPQDELFKKAKIILSGEGATEESQIMHAAFYSPEQCDMPPTDAELTAITTYIASISAP